MLKIYPVLCRAGTMDNYAYILQDGATGISAVLDPSEPQPIIQKLDELGLEPQYILNTHHHFDHTDGNLELKQRYKAQVVANANDASRIPGFDIGVAPGSTFMLGQSPAEIIDVSAHTQGHILWYFPQDKALFTGDTLFNLCVGGLFEGTAEQMYHALAKIKQLPDGIHTTIRNDEENKVLRIETIFIMPLIICSAALKSAITPFCNGRITRIFSGARPYMACASCPTALSLPVRLSRATIEGASTTILSL